MTNQRRTKKSEKRNNLTQKIDYSNEIFIFDDQSQQTQLQQQEQQQQQQKPQEDEQQQQQQQQQDEQSHKVNSAVDTCKKIVNRDNNEASDNETVTNKEIVSDITSSARVVREVQGADKTTINIGVAMNHVNDHDNLKHLNLTLVHVDEFEDMDTQEGKS